jgi:hypothetical protein
LIYSIIPDSHGGDVLSTFYDVNADSAKSDPDKEAKLAYQKYLISHARSGDPNKFKDEKYGIEFPKVDTSGNLLSNVVKIVGVASNNKFELVQDDGNAKDRCSFWAGAMKGLLDDYKTAGGPVDY